MHFVGMLAFRLPVPVAYDRWITLFSLVIAVAASVIALGFVWRKRCSAFRVVCGALVLGAGISGMHYTGMAAMKMHPAIIYDGGLLYLSMAIATIGAGTWLKAASSLQYASHRVRALRAGAALIASLSIVSMHYTGMLAANFPANSVCEALANGFDTEWTAIIVIVATFAVTAIVLALSSVDDARAHTRCQALATALIESNNELKHLAFHDPLTKLPNRLLLEERLTQAAREFDALREPFVVMVIDLDGFKVVNDVYGHRTGDELLVQVGKRLGSLMTDRGMIARLGGDEFVVLSKECQTSAAILARRLVSLINAPYHVLGGELRISASIGIALCPKDGLHSHELVERADDALYHAKTSGRNAFAFFNIDAETGRTR